jgi:hypothetical protein
VNPKDVAARGKVQLDSLPSGGAIHTALAIQNGADKYGAFNWRETPIEAMTYIHALKRHVTAWIDGEDCAADSGIHHLGHAAATLMILMDAMECGTLKDNRPPKGKAADLLARYSR